MKKFSKLDAVVLGISPDTPEKQKAFEKKYDLGIPLLSDPEKTTLEEYGAFGEKKMYGKTVKGVLRSTFLIDPSGKLSKIWRNVRVDGHAEQVLEELEKLKA